ncbi:uncharacterized protein TRIADDRAFT_60634 [Trichoplax adhaerens]|uniref:Uncharacterized protein n=1 Tax=Trichoplax adhaerens TaxID=10228 RepID=B3S8R3_TRIAD|nr:predicted protein [Trichoplax adhaerens]EDV20995.1 predicted protein [Trichoplax adhaerens]|eukprot:XP_002116639.1 predicted protein [Trichoplax adhaerens]
MAKRRPATSTASTKLPIPGLRWIIVGIAIAVCSVLVAMIIYIDVEVTPLSEMFLTQKYFPPGQGLRPKLRRRTRLNPVSCENYGMEKDDLFAKLDGQQCAQAAWESNAETEKENRYVSKIDSVYKSFVNASAAKQYYASCWGNYSYELLPMLLYNNETSNAPKVGDEHKAFSWDYLVAKNDPDEHRQSLLTDEIKAISRHVIYIFRQDKIVVRILVQGFYNSKDQRLNVGLAGRLGSHISDLITKLQPSPLRSQFIAMQESLKLLLKKGLPDTAGKLTDTVRLNIDRITSKLGYEFFRIFSNKSSSENPSLYPKPDEILTHDVILPTTTFERYTIPPKKKYLISQE